MCCTAQAACLRADNDVSAATSSGGDAVESRQRKSTAQAARASRCEGRNRSHLFLISLSLCCARLQFRSLHTYSSSPPLPLTWDAAGARRSLGASDSVPPGAGTMPSCLQLLLARAPLLAAPPLAMLGTLKGRTTQRLRLGIRLRWWCAAWGQQSLAQPGCWLPFPGCGFMSHRGQHTCAYHCTEDACQLPADPPMPCGFRSHCRRNTTGTRPPRRGRPPAAGRRTAGCVAAGRAAAAVTGWRTTRGRRATGTLRCERERSSSQ